MATCLCHLQELTLCGKGAVSVAELQSLTALTSLQELWLEHPVKAADLEKVPRLPVTVMAVAITAPRDLVYLARWLDACGSEVRSLALQADEMMEAAVTQEVFVSIKKSAPMLKALLLCQFELLSAELMAPLCSLKQLEGLKVQDSSFDSAAVCALSALTSLSLLGLAGSDWRSSEGQGFGLAGLTCLPKLEELCVTGPQGVLEECRQAWAERVLEEMDVCWFKLRPL